MEESQCFSHVTILTENGNSGYLLKMVWSKSSQSISFQVYILQSSQPAKNDVHINFIELIVKRALYRSSAHYFKGIIEDIYNLAACINKLNVFHKVWLEEKKFDN